MKKLKLKLDALVVDSFRIPNGARDPGTVRAHADCTWFDSCLCKTAYYYCGTGPHTIYSCDYTADDRCKTADCSGDTSWEQCGTPPGTPVC